MTLFLIIVLVLVILIIVLTYKYKKKFRFDSICQVNGAVGSGKTSTCVYFAIRECRVKRRITKIKSFFSSNMFICKWNIKL